MYMAELTPGYIIQSVQVPDFIVEDISKDIQRLAGGIRKQFTSQASSYSVVFKWDFGDGNTVNTAQRTVTHAYSNPGIYTVKHQACLLDSPCCYNNNIPWCVKAITVGTPICDFITNAGGWNNLNWVNHVLCAYYTYIGSATCNVGFSITWNNVLGLYYYYIGNKSAGNTNTGCTF